MSVTLGSTSAPFVRRGKDLNYVLTLATLTARHANEATEAPMRSSARVWSQEVGFVLLRSAEVWFQLT
jgi:hypothetical protein